MKEVKEVLKFLIEAGKAADQYKKELGIGNAALLVSPLMHAAPAFEGIEKVKEEFKTMSKEQKDELITWVAQELTLESARTEELIEKGFALLLDVLAFIKLLKK